MDVSLVIEGPVVAEGVGWDEAVVVLLPAISHVCPAPGINDLPFKIRQRWLPRSYCPLS
jgi:hypothetical protein